MEIENARFIGAGLMVLTSLLGAYYLVLKIRELHSEKPDPKLTYVTYSHMEKRGSRYLRYALYNATKYVCLWDPTFATYLAKKRTEGKHYNVAISHAAKKLVRLIYAMEISRRPYTSAA